MGRSIPTVKTPQLHQLGLGMIRNNQVVSEPFFGFSSVASTLLFFDLFLNTALLSDNEYKLAFPSISRK